MWTSELMFGPALRAVAIGALASSLACAAHALASVPALERPVYGMSGRRRAEALRDGLFAWLEPVLRLAGAWLGRLPLAPLRLRLERSIHVAGNCAGLRADELIAAMLLTALATMLGWLAVDGSREWLGCWAMIGLVLPVLRVRKVALERAKSLERSLPSAMDLCALCMGAGADFPAAIRFVADDLGPEHAVCREELRMILDELRLGRTRVQALTALGDRSASRAVRELVAALVQSEQKGTPLVEVLAIQAATLRQRRSVRAEELAAQAGVKLMLPLMLMVSSLLLIVFGPFVVQGVGL